MKGVILLLLMTVLFLICMNVYATEPPTVQNGESCGPGFVSIYAFGNDAAETFKWYKTIAQ